MCRACGKWFQLNRTKKEQSSGILVQYHVRGLSYRNIGGIHQQDGSTAYRHVSNLVKHLPHCADITRRYCTKYCGILLVDGKYVAVKGYERKIPVLYGIDYLTHDIPTYLFSVAENYVTCRAYFQSLKLLNYPLQALVCDDNVNIYQACLEVYPRAFIQLCQNHYKEGLRQALNVRTDPTYVKFFYEVNHLFTKKYNREEFWQRAHHITKFYEHDSRCLSVMVDIQKRYDMLFAYQQIKHVPRTTNMIESFNSHLQGRLKTVKGFESFKSADDWLNSYFLLRRIKPFTDCEGKFKHLNGHSSLSKTVKDKSCLDAISQLFR